MQVFFLKKLEQRHFKYHCSNLIYPIGYFNKRLSNFQTIKICLFYFTFCVIERNYQLFFFC